MKLYLSLGILYLIESLYLYKVTNEPIVSGVFLCIGIVSILLNIEKLSIAIAVVSVALPVARVPIQYQDLKQKELDKIGKSISKPVNQNISKLPDCSGLKNWALVSCQEKVLEINKLNLAVAKENNKLIKDIDKKVESKISESSILSNLAIQVILGFLIPVAICTIEINRNKKLAKDSEKDKFRELSLYDQFLLLHKQGYTFKQIGVELNLNKTKLYRVAKKLNLSETKVKQGETGVKLRRVN